MTAVTGQPAADQSGRGVSGGVRHAAQLRHGVAQSGAVGDALSAAGHQAPAAPGGTCRTVVPRPRPVAAGAVISDGSAATSAATVVPLPPQVTAAARGARRDASDQSEPAAASLVEDGRERAAVAYVDGLDGSERKVLMHHIAQAFPGVVEAGVELVAQWRAEAAEERRKKGRRHEHDRRRRRRAEEGNRS